MGGAVAGLAAKWKKKEADAKAAAAAAAALLAGNIKSATAEGKNIVATAKLYSNPNNGFKFNLPPHGWSLPIKPIQLEHDYTNKNSPEGLNPAIYSDSSLAYRHVVGGGYGNSIANSKSHGLRRSRIWFYGALEGSTVINADGTQGTTTNAQQTANNLVEAAKKGNYKPGTTGVLDRQYGFQFLWNPTDISLSVNRNADITPNAADRSGQLTGNFQGQENLSFTITIDRTNDFACAKGLVDVYGNLNAKDLSRYYTAFFPKEDNQISVEDKIKELLKLGTMADIEYLFKTVNGGGSYITDPKTGKVTYKAYTNGLGKITADTGYLAATIVAIQFGPGTDSLCYTGWIDSLSISHSKFTENMIPLTSQINVSMTCFSSQPF